MSTIERAADLLRSLRESPQKPAASEGAALQPDAIERIAGSLVAKGKSAHATGARTRTFKVDRNRLREQSMITPDGERTARSSRTSRAPRRARRRRTW
jgi:hypothetical protein